MGDRLTDTLEETIHDLDGTIARLSGKPAQGDPDVASERRYFEAQRRAYVRALYHVERGVEPTAAGGAWLVPSNSRAELVHRVTRQGEILTCDCEAAVNGRRCWHVAAAECAELVLERADEYDEAPAESTPEPEPPPPAAPQLRLVERPDLGDDAEYIAVVAFGRAA